MGAKKYLELARELDERNRPQATPQETSQILTKKESEMSSHEQLDVNGEGLSDENHEAILKPDTSSEKPLGGPHVEH